MTEKMPGINEEAQAAIAAAATLGLLHPGVTHVQVYHQATCRSWASGQCGCRPELSLIQDDGETWQYRGALWQRVIGGRFGAN